MSALPQGWQRAKLSEICKRIVDGSHTPPKAVAEGFPMLSARNIQNQQILFDVFRFISPDDFERENARTRIQPGDVLVTIVGAIGRTAVVPSNVVPFVLQRSVAVLKPLEVDPRYLSYALNSPTVQNYLEDNAKGTAQRGIYLGALAQVEIPFPPIAEQKRIADKLDVLLARVDACRARLDRVPAILKRFRQAVLAAAVSGRLTEEWRGSCGVNDTWRKATFGAIGETSGGLTKNSSRASSDLRKPYLRVANVYANKLDLSDVAEIGLTAAEYRKTLLARNDLLIVEGNGSIDQIGRAAIWTGEIADCVHQNHLIRWRTQGEVTPKFALFWLLSPQGRASLVAVASSTTGLHTLSISKIEALPIRLPSLEEQENIVSRVETLLADIDQVERRYAAARNQVEQLTPSLLAKAFRGELVALQ